MKHKIEIFSAGCENCKDTIETVKKLAGSEHEVVVHDMHQQEIASRAAQHGVRSLPAVLVNGKLAGCCAGRGVEEQVLPRSSALMSSLTNPVPISFLPSLPEG
jgi:glutaredoxin